MIRNVTSSLGEHARPIKIVFLDRATLPPHTRLKKLSCSHELAFRDKTSPPDVAAAIANAHIVITNKAPIDAQAIADAADLKLIAIAATGTDIVDLAACAKRRVTVSNVRGYAVNSVSEHVFALILALRRNLLAYRQSVLSGRWQTAGQFCFFDHPIRDLANATIGIIGAGTLGQAVASRARAFGMNVLFSARRNAREIHPPFTSFENVLRQSDIITLHVPLSPSTHGMIGEEEFRQMEKRPLIINTARGGIVDEAALRNALAGGLVSGAGFDVSANEPPQSSSPLLALQALPNFILTPHIAWAGQDASQALADQLIDNIEAFLNGTPRNVVGADTRMQIGAGD